MLIGGFARVLDALDPHPDPDDADGQQLLPSLSVFRNVAQYTSGRRRAVGPCVCA